MRGMRGLSEFCDDVPIFYVMLKKKVFFEATVFSNIILSSRQLLDLLIQYLPHSSFLLLHISFDLSHVVIKFLLREEEEVFPCSSLVNNIQQRERERNLASYHWSKKSPVKILTTSFVFW